MGCQTWQYRYNTSSTQLQCSASCCLLRCGNLLIARTHSTVRAEGWVLGQRLLLLTGLAHAGNHATGSEGALAASSAQQQQQDLMQGPGAGKSSVSTHFEVTGRCTGSQEIATVCSRQVMQAKRKKLCVHHFHGQPQGPMTLQGKHRLLQHSALGRGSLQRVGFRCATLYAKLRRAQRSR